MTVQTFCCWISALAGVVAWLVFVAPEAFPDLYVTFVEMELASRRHPPFIWGIPYGICCMACDLTEYLTTHQKVGDSRTAERAGNGIRMARGVERRYNADHLLGLPIEFRGSMYAALGTLHITEEAQIAYLGLVTAVRR